MLISVMALKGKFPNQQYYSDYAKLALRTRPGWRQIGESYFEHTSGLGIAIDKDHSMKQIIKAVVEVEISNAVSGHADADLLVSIAVSEVDKYLSRSRES